MTNISREHNALQAYSVAEFCKAHSISRSFFYGLLKSGRGPRICKVGNRTLISREAAFEWRNNHSAAIEQPDASHGPRRDSNRGRASHAVAIRRVRRT